jgi:hypothetical protein
MISSGLPAATATAARVFIMGSSFFYLLQEAEFGRSCQVMSRVGGHPPRDRIAAPHPELQAIWSYDEVILLHM